MGMGPPVCVACRLVMHLDEARRPCWMCPACGKSGDDPEGVSSLFNYPRAEWDDMQRSPTVDVHTADLALMLAIHDEDPLLIEHAKRRYSQAFDITISLTHDGDLWRCQVNGGDETVGISPLPVLRMAVRQHVATLPIRKARGASR